MFTCILSTQTTFTLHSDLCRCAPAISTARSTECCLADVEASIGLSQLGEGQSERALSGDRDPPASLELVAVRTKPLDLHEAGSATVGVAGESVGRAGGRVGSRGDGNHNSRAVFKISWE